MRIHDYQTGDTMSFEQVNAEAMSLYQQAVDAVARRYVHFMIMLPFGALDSDLAAFRQQFKIRSPFKWDIVYAELYARDDSASASQVITADISGATVSYRQLSTTIAADTGSTNPFYSDAVNSVVHVPADEEITIQAANSSATAIDDSWVVLHGRYDAMDGITIPTPPQVRAGEAYSATEWNTWFSNMATVLGNAATAAGQRKHIELYACNAITSGVLSFPDGVAKIIRGPSRGVSTGVPGVLDSADAYIAMNAVRNTSFSLYNYVNGTPTTLATKTSTATGTALTRGAMTISNTDTDTHLDDLGNPDNSIHAEFQNASSGSGGEIYNAVIVAYWTT